MDVEPMTSFPSPMDDLLSLDVVLCFLGTLVGVILASVWWKKRDVVAPRDPYTGVAVLQSSFTGGEIPCVSPSTGEVVGKVHAATPNEVEQCVARARKAQGEWMKTSFADRRAVLREVMDYVVENQEEICRYSVVDSGKTLMEAEYGEILTTCEKLRWTIKYGEACLRRQSRSPPLLLFLKKAWVEWIPLGVIGIIIPWNYPFHNVASAVTAAIFSGNAAVVKVSEYSAYSASFFGSIFRRALAMRGHNPDLVQLITGYGDTGAALCKSKGVNKIFFIGSPEVGKKVMETAATNLTPVTLELGGKDPLIIFEDADFDQGCECAMRGCFINNGQNCVAAERIYVHEAIYDKFVRVMGEQVRALKQGSPLCGERVDCGAMTMPQQLEKVEGLVNEAIAQGAQLVAGGTRRTDTKGLFLQPMMLTNVTHDMRIVKQETFGPVMLVIKFKDVEDVIAKANDSDYGLSCSVFSNNLKKAEDVARRIASGMCVVNDFGVGYLIQALPFGGVKASGFGRFNGPEGLQSFCNPKSFTTDRFPRVLTKAPSFTRYPVWETGDRIVRAAVHLIYDKSWRQRVRAVIELVKLLVRGRNGK